MISLMIYLGDERELQYCVVWSITDVFEVEEQYIYIADIIKD